jgi:predicted permease
LLSESLMLGLAGGVVGVALAAAAIRVVRAMATDAVPRVTEIGLDPTVVAFAALLSVVAGLLFGLIPVLKFASPRLAALRDGGRTGSDGRERHRTRNALVVSEIAMALVLLISSALMIQTFQALGRVDPGFTRGEEVLTAGLWIPPGLAPDSEQVMRQHREIVRRIERVPGVQSVGLGSWISLTGGGQGNPLLVRDLPQTEGQAPPTRKMKWISPGYFETMGTRLVAGRQMTWGDVFEYAPVVMINDCLARELWRTPAAALGKLVRESPKSPWREIIGVVGNEHLDGLAREAPAIVYYPSLVETFLGRKPGGQRWMIYAIRSTRTGSPTFTKEIQQAVSSIDRSIPLARVRTLEEITAASMAQTSFALVMLTIAAGVSLLLSVVGVYGVIAYITAQRAREVGIRVALGAQSGDVTRLFVRHNLLLAGLGISFGVSAAVALSRLMASLLFGVSATDPMTYVVVSAGLAGVAVLAGYLPSRGAARVDPLVALRGM